MLTGLNNWVNTEKVDLNNSLSIDQYDLLLSDIGMPCEDGYFLIQQVRELGASMRGQIPAIALTHQQS